MRQHVVVRASASHFAIRLDLFAVLLRIVVLLAVLVQTMVTFDRLTGRRPMPAGALLQLFYQTAVRLLAMLSFRVALWATRPP